MTSKNDLIQSLIDEGYLKTPRIIDAFRAVDRGDFVLPEYQDQAYGNHPLPIGFGQTISQPLTVAFMLELLDPLPGEKILDIGSGSGWTTALLAYAVNEDGKVFGLERIKELYELGQKNLAKYFNESRAKIICGDGFLGLEEEAPFDKILAGAAASRNIPKVWRKQLKVGGKIVAPVESSVWLFIKKGENEFEEKEYPGFSFVPLVVEKKSKIKNQKSKLQFKIKKFIILLAFLIAVLGGFLMNEIYRPHTAFSGSKSMKIPAGLGSRKIAELLKREGVIRSKWVLVVYASLTGKASLLKSGSYIFFNSSTISKIATDLVRGGTNERAITVVEGWSVQDVGDYFEREDILSSEMFLELVNARHSVSRNKKFDFLTDKPEKAGLEGYLFPDTYRIFINAGVEDIILKMLENFGRKLNPDLRKEIAAQKKTIFEIVTMASMIEKEVISDQDRALVSGILWKRLGLGMGLQVDATITYLKKIRNPKSEIRNGRITIEDIKIDSSYNTYKYRGLPPGPIASPGLSAIKAAIYPKESPYLYYLSTNEGKTIFSKTLEEHNLAKAKYLK